MNTRARDEGAVGDATEGETNVMDGAPEFPGEMKLELRLATDRVGGLVRLSARRRIQASGTHDGRRLRHSRDVVPVFVAAVDLGLFQGPKEGQTARVINVVAALSGSERVDEWEVLTPPLDADAFVALARMFWAVGAEAVGITEMLRDKERAIHSLDQVPRSTVRLPPWPVERLLDDTAKNVVVTVCFDRPVGAELIGCTYSLLRAWGALVSLGAFPGGEASPTSAAVLHQLGEERQQEVFATFETLTLGPEGWGSLWAGLLRIHRRAPIARVEMQ